MAEERTEPTYRVAERLVDDDLVALVTESAQQNTDLDMCGARHAVMARNIAEDVLEHLLNAGWLPPDEAKPPLALAAQTAGTAGPETGTPRAYTPEAVAKLFGTRDYTVRRWIRLGYIQAVRVGRRFLVPAAEVDLLLAGSSGGDTDTTTDGGDR